MTLFIQDPGLIGLGGASILPPAEEISLSQNAALVEWWRADVGVSNSGDNTFSWIGRKNYYPLTMLGTGGGGATRETNILNSKPAIRIPVTSSLSAASILPTAASVSVLIVGRRKEDATSASLFGSGYTTASTDQWRMVHLNNNKVGIVIGGTASGLILNATSTVAWPLYSAMMLSYDKAGGTASIRQNHAQIDSASSLTSQNDCTNSTFVVGGESVNGTTGDTGSDCLEVMVFNVALHAVANADLLDLVDTYITARYANSL